MYKDLFIINLPFYTFPHVPSKYKTIFQSLLKTFLRKKQNKIQHSFIQEMSFFKMH